MPASRDDHQFAIDDAAACPLCGATDTLVIPNCAEGHGDECPDRICALCGFALFVDPVLSTTSPRAARIA